MSEFDNLSHEESKKVVRLLASHPNEAQAFINSTHENKGASMFLHNMSMVNYGDKMHIVGKEPSKKTNEPVPTKFVDKGSSSPHLSAIQFGQHFLRLKEHAKSSKALMGS